MSDAKTVALAGVLLVSLATTAHAQPAPSDGEARRLFDQGVALIRDQRYADAAAALEQSLAIRETPPIHYNLGIAYRGLGSYRRAVGAFERFQELAGNDRRYAAMAAEVPVILAELRIALAHLRIVVRGGATDVRVDDESIATADGTYEIVADPGRRRVTASRSGYQPAIREVDLANGATADVELDASAAALPATLAVEATPASATIEVDGERRGAGSWQSEVAPGEHTVWVRAPGYVPQRRALQVRPGATERLTVSLTAVAAPREEPAITGRWWFWAGATAIVAGAVVAVVLLAQPEPQPFEDGSLGFTIQVLR